MPPVRLGCPSVRGPWETSAVLAISGAAVVAAAVGGTAHRRRGDWRAGAARSSRRAGGARPRVRRPSAGAPGGGDGADASGPRSGRQAVIRQGDPADRFSVASGVRVTRRGLPASRIGSCGRWGRTRSSARSGSCAVAAPAAVTACTDGLLLTLDGSEFLELPVGVLQTGADVPFSTSTRRDVA